MGKTNFAVVLGTVFKDISSIRNIIKDCNNVNISSEKVDFNDEEAVQKIVEDTKNVVKTLKTEVLRIEHYLDENCTNWSSSSTTNNQEESTVKNKHEGENDLAVCNSEVQSVNSDNTDSEQKPKAFLKCVDINKLIDPKVLDTKTPNNVVKNLNDSVLVISDSDQETQDQGEKSKSKRSKVCNDQNKINSSSQPEKQVKKPKQFTIIHSNIVKSKTGKLAQNTKGFIIKKYVLNKDTVVSSEVIEVDPSVSDSKRNSPTNIVKVYPGSSQNKLIKIRTNANLRNDLKLRSKPYVFVENVDLKQMKSFLENIKKNKNSDTDTLSHGKKRSGLSPTTDSQLHVKKKVKCSINSSEDDKDNEINVPTEPVTSSDVQASLPNAEPEDEINVSEKEKPNEETDKSKESTDAEIIASEEPHTETQNSPTPEESIEDKEAEPKTSDSTLAINNSESEKDGNKSTDEQNDSFAEKIKRKKKKQNKIMSDSDSDSQSKGKDESPEENSSSSESEKDDAEKKPQKRRRIKKINDSSSEEEEEKSTRKAIRKLIKHDSLADTTKQAEKDEIERKTRISERQMKYNQIFDLNKPQDATTDKLVLDFNEETKQEILAVNKELIKKLKPHQVKGVQFMWDACFESVERAKTTKGSGCILAHCMGLGKTLQVVTFAHTLLVNEKLTGVNKVLVVCPLNTVLNWVSEFQKWLSDIGEPEIDVYDLVSSKQLYEREYQIKYWHENGGVLIIGYDMFRNLTNSTNKKMKKKMQANINCGLVDPGPDLVVCDEGHLLKNEKTNLSIAMNRIRTLRRIVLTGTPMQNNLKEYYCMVQFVKPNLLGTYKEYLNRFVNPITNGQYTDSTQHDINIMRRRAHVLHKMLDGLVQRNDYSVLTPFLPPKYEYVLFLLLSEVQIKLYQFYKDNFSQRNDGSKMRSSVLFSDFQEFQRICTHPRVLLNKSEARKKQRLFTESSESEGSLKDFIDDDSESDSSTNSSNSDASSKDSGKKENVKHQRLTRKAAADAGIDVDETPEVEIVGQTEWWQQFCDAEELDNIAHSSKLYLLFQILQHCEYIGDKLLVFSQSLTSLDIIEYFLSKIDDATQRGDNETMCGFSGSWALGLDYFRLDGSSSCDNRAIWCKHFNNESNPRARLFLISTKAGGLGINLTGANRVVIFDVSWNPSHDTQSIYRVFRFGQTKPCYIYRFVTYGTMEMKLYERQVTKQAISKRVIDEQQIDRHYNQTDLAELYRFEPRPAEQITPLVPKDVLLGELLQKEKGKIYKYHEHQSLLENKEDEELNEDERKTAWEEFENEKVARTSMGWIQNLPINTVKIGLRSLMHKDNPSWTAEQVETMIPTVLEQLKIQVAAGELRLFNRIVTEMRMLQVAQQQQYQEYIVKQQQIRLFQQLQARLAQSSSNNKVDISHKSNNPK